MPFLGSSAVRRRNRSTIARVFPPPGQASANNSPGVSTRVRCWSVSSGSSIGFPRLVKCADDGRLQVLWRGELGARLDGQGHIVGELPFGDEFLVTAQLSIQG